ncbi:MAG: lysylphosphatidylglycerol synthase transmembrane domain-containing protein [Candidatus Ranarchaeia archaeon]
MEQRTTAIITIISIFAIIFWLQITIGLQQVFLTLIGINPIWLIPPFSLLILSYILRTIRWNIILRSYKHPTEGMKLAPILCGGTWMNLVIPLKIAELVRPFWLKDKKLYSLTQGISSILIERFFDFCILLLVSISMSILVFSSTVQDLTPRLASTIIIFSALIVFFVAIRSERFIAFITKVIAKTFSPSKRLREQVPRFTEQLATDLRQLIVDRRNGPLALLISLPIWLLEAAKLVFIGVALGSHIPLEIALFAGSLSYVAGHALIVPAGIGIFFSQYLFLAILIPDSIATAVALLDVIVYVVWLTVTGAPSIFYLGAGTIALSEEDE